jgi:hypothetical protein
MNLAAQKFTKRPKELTVTYLPAADGEGSDFGFVSAITGNIIGGTAYLWVDAFAANSNKSRS